MTASEWRVRAKRSDDVYSHKTERHYAKTNTAHECQRDDGGGVYYKHSTARANWSSYIGYQRLASARIILDYKLANELHMNKLRIKREGCEYTGNQTSLSYYVTGILSLASWECELPVMKVLDPLCKRCSLGRTIFFSFFFRTEVGLMPDSAKTTIYVKCIACWALCPMIDLWWVPHHTRYFFNFAALLNWKRALDFVIFFIYSTNRCLALSWLLLQIHHMNLSCVAVCCACYVSCFYEHSAFTEV